MAEKQMSAAEAILNAPDPAATVAPATDKAEPGAKRKKKTRRNVDKARAYIYAGENNTIVTITDMKGDVLAWASSGSSGFKGARKSTPYAAKVAAERAMSMVAPYSIQTLSITVKGIGPGREQAIRGLQVAGVNFDSIVDETPIAHGGCRPPKPRRI